MGAGASASLPTRIDHDTFQRLAGNRYSKELFDKFSDGGFISLEALQEMDQMVDVYISYDRSDLTRVMKITEALSVLGLSVCIPDRRDDSAAGDLMKRMNLSSIFLYFVSANYVSEVDSQVENSSRDEFIYALDTGRLAIPVLLESSMKDPTKWTGPLEKIVGEEMKMLPPNLVEFFDDINTTSASKTFSDRIKELYRTITSVLTPLDSTAGLHRLSLLQQVPPVQSASGRASFVSTDYRSAAATPPRSGPRELTSLTVAEVIMVFRKMNLPAKCESAALEWKIDGAALDCVRTPEDLVEAGIEMPQIKLRAFFKQLETYKANGVPLSVLQDGTPGTGTASAAWSASVSGTTTPMPHSSYSSEMLNMKLLTVVVETAESRRNSKSTPQVETSASVETLVNDLQTAVDAIETVSSSSASGDSVEKTEALALSERALKAIATSIAGDAAKQKALGQVPDAIKNVVTLIARSIPFAAICEVGLSAVCVLCRHGAEASTTCLDNVKALGENGMCDCVAEICVNLNENISLATQAFKTVANLSGGNNENAKQLGSKGVCDAIIMTVKTLGTSNSQFVKSVCWAISNLACGSNDNKTRLGAQGACEAIATVLATHGAFEPSSAQLACLAVLNLASGNLMNSSKFVMCGTAEGICCAVNVHASDLSVAQNGCAAIASLTANPENMQRLSTAGCIATLIQMLTTHGGTSPLLAEQIFVGLTNLLTSSPDNVNKVGMSGGCEAVVRTLAAHGTSSPVIVFYGCSTLLNLASGNTMNQSKIRSAGSKELLTGISKSTELPPKVRNKAKEVLEKLWVKRERETQVSNAF